MAGTRATTISACLHSTYLAAAYRHTAANTGMAGGGYLPVCRVTMSEPSAMNVGRVTNVTCHVAYVAIVFDARWRTTVAALVAYGSNEGVAKLTTDEAYSWLA